MVLVVREFAGLLAMVVVPILQSLMWLGKAYNKIESDRRQWKSGRLLPLLGSSLWQLGSSSGLQNFCHYYYFQCSGDS